MQSPIILSHNENPYGMPPKVNALFKNGLSFHRYPDFRSQRLKDKLSEHYDLMPQQLICGTGSEEIIYKAISTLTKPHESIIVHQHSFHIYQHAAKQAHVNVKVIPQPDLKYHVDKILNYVCDNTSMVVLDNPCNPLGCLLTRHDLVRLLNYLPSRVKVLIDAAYADFVTNSCYSDGRDLIREFDNLLITRTFSKLYGLAGLRLGWAYGSEEIIQRVNEQLPPYNVNTLAGEAGLVALEDSQWINSTRHKIIESRRTLEQFFEEVETPYWPSQGNFVLCKPRSLLIYNLLEKEGIRVRNAKLWGLPNHLRISIGTEKEMQRFYLLWSKEAVQF